MPSRHFCSKLYWQFQLRRLAKKKIKSIQIGKEEIKLYLFADDTILYIENPKAYTQTHTKPIKADKKFSKVTGYNIQYKKVQQGYRIQYPI